MSRPRWALVAAFGAGAATLLFFRLVRGYPWGLAALVAIAMVALVGASFRTYERTVGAWRSEWRRDDGAEERESPGRDAEERGD